MAIPNMELGLNVSSLNLLLQYLVLVTCLTCFIKWIFTTWSKTAVAPPHKIKRPPSPPRFPIIGNFHQILMGSSSSLPHRSLQSLSQKYGPLMMVSLGSKPVLVASTAEAAREITKDHDLVFSGRPKSKILEKIMHGSLDVAFAPYGEYWRELKSISVLQLLSNTRVRSYHGIREEETSRMIEKIRQRISNSTSSVINLSEMLVTLTTDIITGAIIGRRYSSDLSCEDSSNNNNNNNNKIVRMYKAFAEVAGNANITDYIPWLAWINHFNGYNAKVDRVSKEIDEVMDDIIEQHKIKYKKEGYKDVDKLDETGDSSDFVDILLDVQRRNLTTFPLELSTIKAVLIDMIGAGTDSTYTLMDWVMVELLRHPEVMEKLQNEVREAVIVEGKTQVVTEDDLPRMSYLKAVIKEASRLHPPLPLLLPHESTQDVKVMGYDISAGTQVLINAWAIGRDPKSWEKPEEFRPERFLNSNVDFRGCHYELIPFGAGRRGCPGISFSSAVSELTLARLLHSFNFSLPTGVKPGEIDMTENNGINGKRKLPLLVHVSPYSS